MTKMHKLILFMFLVFLTLGFNVSGFAQTFRTSDLAGTWYGYVSETNPAVGTYWLYGFFAVDSSGNVTGGTYNAPDGTAVTVTGGQFSLDNNGIMTGTLTVEGGGVASFPSGKMNSSKTMMTFVGADNLGSLDIGIAIKGGGSFSTGDLAGTWYGYVSETNPAVGTYWLYGFFAVDSSGNVTGGTYNAPDGTAVTVTGGQFSLDNNGIMTGTLTVEGGGVASFPSGKMNSSKTMMTFVGADNLGSLDIGIAIKGGVTPLPFIPLLLLD